MNTKEAISTAMGVSRMVLGSYVEDLSDADLMQCPGKGCNHLAWQLGHLVSSGCMLLNAVKPGAAPELPEGFEEHHGKDKGCDTDAANFCTKQEYLDLLDKVQAATQEALQSFSDEDLDAPSPEMFREKFPTVGMMFILMGMHGMMHAGQFVPVRRMLDKPVSI